MISDIFNLQPLFVHQAKPVAIKPEKNEKALGETQTLRAGRSNRAAKNFRPAANPLPGGAGPPKFNQLEMVTTCTYRPSLVKIDAPQLASAQCNNKKQQQKATKRTRPNYLLPPRELYVFIGVCLFVSRINAKTTRTIFTKFGGKAAHGPWKNPLDTGGNPDHAPAGRRRKLCLYQVTGKV